MTFQGTTAVGSSSQSVTVTVKASAAGTVNSINALTGGQPNLDFAAVPDSCTNTMTLAVADTCTVTVTFSPRFPGVRQGAVLLQDSNGNLLGTALLSGIGQGGLPVLAPGEINTVAGDGEWIYQADHVKAINTSIFLPTGLAVDAAGNLYLCDSNNNRVRKVDTNGYITTVAGSGNPGSQGDGGQAIAAELSDPSGLALDGAGNLYIADSGNSVIRRVDAISGVITTVAGQIGFPGYAGQNVPATSAKLLTPQGLALTPAGDLVIADTGNNVVRLLTVSTGYIQTIAGTGTAGYSGDSNGHNNIVAANAELNSPYGVAVRADGAIAIADMSNQRVRLVDQSGNITTIAGSGTRSFSGDNGSATQAALDGPAAVAFDPAGDLFIADSGNNRVRGVFGNPGVIETLAGDGNTTFAGDGYRDDQASLNGPYALFFDAIGNLWVSDFFHNRVREIQGSVLGLSYPVMKVGKTSASITVALFNGGNTTLTLHSPGLVQAALDPDLTTCNASSPSTPIAPMAFCNMGLEFAPTATGDPATGTVTWLSDAPNVTPVDNLSGQVLSVEPTSVVVTSNVNPGLLGSPVILAATVTSDDTGRTGAVTFSEGTTNWCTAVPLASDGTAVCNIQSLSLGSHSFIANYTGDNNNAASTSPAFVEIIKQQPALLLGAASPSVVTNPVQLTFNAQDQSGTPTGTVTFLDGSTPLATVTLNASGSASWSTTTFALGTHSLSAQYSGDSANVSGTSNTVQEQIDQANTLTVLSSSNSDATVGAAVTFTATVVSNNGPAPTQTVQFTDGTGAGAIVLGSAPLSSDGKASLTVTTLAPGVHSIVATYSGDTDHATSRSSAMPQTIQQIATVTSLSPDANPLNAGATLHLTAMVALAPGATANGALTGTVTFSDGKTVLGSAALNNTGEASLAIGTLSVGSHTIVASFNGNTNYASSNSTALNETVQQTATQITLSSGSANTLLGEPATFTAVVSSATGIPTGTVNLRDGATVIATVTLDASGHATFSTSKLTQGTHTMSAVYSGDSNYTTATSAGLQQTVQLAQPTLTLSGPAGAVDAGTNAQFFADLSTPGTAPAGTLTLRDSGAGIATLAVSASGNYTFNTSQLAIGLHTLTAFYGGDADNAAATSAAVTVTIRQASSSTALLSSANPLTQGSALTLTATVSSDSPNAGGQMNFYDGAILLGSAVLNANGVAFFSPGRLTLGMHSLTATYAGDTNHATSTSVPLPELVVQSSAATLASDNNPAASGQTVTFSAQIRSQTPINGIPAPTGTASFRDNGTLLAAVPLNGSGAVSFATGALTVGTHTVTVSYAGDANYAATGAQLTQTVVDASTQVMLVASANPATYGQPLNLAATVTSNGTEATGTVTFIDGTTAIGSAALNGNAVAVLTISTLKPGAHTITANYNGDGKASSSISAPVAVVVKQTTALAVTSSINPVQTLSSVNFTVTLTNAGAAPATGTVTFIDGNTAIGTASLDGTGHATLTLPQMSAGTHKITASYAGDGGDFASSSAVFTETVQLRPTTTTVTGSLTDASNPQQVTLIAVVKGQGSTPPTGMVTFTNGSVTMGASPADATGVASLTVIFETTTEPVVASYAGDASYTASQSASTSITAGQAPQFTLAVNVPSLTLVTHQHSTINVSLGSVKGFTDTIALGCEGLPYAATCTFSPSQLKLAADGTATATLIVDTGDPLGAGSGTTAYLTHARGTLLCFLPVGLLLGLVQRKKTRNTRRKLGTLLVLAFAFALTMGTTGCGGLNTSGTPPGSYSFKVIGTGQGSGATEAQGVTMEVTQ